jgi:hypothetical protein
MPKGVTDARREKTNANADEFETKKRRSHDPNRGLESLPASRFFTSERFSSSVDQNAKNLLTILYSLSGLDSKIRPEIRNLDDFKNWAKKLQVDDNGFVIVKQTGVTGNGISITRGSTYGKAIHITSGGKTYTNKRGAHIFLCGTISHKSSHIIADLSDPYVKNLIPILENMEIIDTNDNDIVSRSTNAGNKDDGDIAFAETEVQGQSYLILIEAAKLINPKVSYRRPKNIIIKTKDDSKLKTKRDETSYIVDMDLPTYDVADGSVQVSKRNYNQSIDLSNGNNDEEEDDDDDDDDEDDDLAFE